jgi:nucleotide-binding universal stress UspA family protein
MSRNLYLVTYDFTPVGDAAVQYGLHLAKYVNVELVIFHVAKSTSDAAAKTQLLNQMIGKLEKPNNCVITSLVRSGSIFDTIGKVAGELKVQLILMGTHGTKGLQKLFGSNAIKVISSTDVPFLIVQEGSVMTELEDIVIPVNILKESLQISKVMGDLAAIFGSTVHIIAEKQNDSGQSMLLKNRMLIVQKNYDDRKIKSKIQLLERKGNYINKILAYSKENSIDLIGIAYYSASLLPQFDTFAQNILMNQSKLPCLIIKAKEADSTYF